MKINSFAWKRALIMLALCFPIACFFSCKRCPCIKAQFQVNLIAFADFEIDGLVLKRFVKATQFQTLQDSLLLDSTVVNFYHNGDTISLFFIAPLYINSSFDYKMVFPLINKTVSISKINEIEQTKVCGCICMDPGPGCFNEVKSYQVDDSTYSTGAIIYEIYIRR